MELNSDRVTGTERQANSSGTVQTQPEHKPPTFFGHPIGLANLFGVEMWERFSFYGMQAILLYYLTYSIAQGGLNIDKAVGTAIIGAYGGSVYLFSILGGWVADHILGAERTVFYSAIIIMLGHISLSLIPGFAGVIIGLVLVAVGSGGLKTTASTVLGDLYDRTDPRRDAGFSIFYMGINIGALIGPLLTGWLWGAQGFHWGFGLAAIGMFIGLMQYSLLRKKTLASVAPIEDPLPFSRYAPTVLGVVVLLVILAVLFATGVLDLGWISTVITLIALVATLVMFIQMFTSPHVTRIERRRLIGFIPMFIATIAFFSVFQQQFTVIALYSDERLNRVIGSFELSPAWVNSINPIFVIIFSAVFAGIWQRLGSRQPSTPVKYSIAIVIIGIAALFFIPFAGGGANSTPLLAIVWILFLFTMGELLISPVGISLATKLSPKAFHTRMMSLHYLSVSIGTSLAGTFAGFYHPESGSAERTYFTVIAIVCIIIGVILFLLKKPILSWFEGVR